MSTDGAELIAAERQRQIESEGYASDHDKGRSRDLMDAAFCYIVSAYPEEALDGPPAAWPWAAEHWKPSNPERDLVKAGALIAAAIDAQREGDQ